MKSHWSGRRVYIITLKLESVVPPVIIVAVKAAAKASS
jgi:hypothetical protein